MQSLTRSLLCFKYKNVATKFQISKVRTSPKDPENKMFLNAEEENFIPLCDMYLSMEDEGEPIKTISAFDEVILMNRLIIKESASRFSIKSSLFKNYLLIARMSLSNTNG